MAEGPGNLKVPPPGGLFLTIKHFLDDGQSGAETVIKLSGVSVVLGGNQVIHGIDWRVERGENWAVVGPNGSGKTTLLRLLNGYLWPARGAAAILGMPFGRVDLRELRRSIGFVSPHMDGWFSEEERVLDVVVSGASASTRLWLSPGQKELLYATALVRRVGCGEHLQERFGQLSQGEKRRITIARALMAKPLLITLDEPCAGLDVSGREDFLSTLSSIAKGHVQTMVYVTHRIEEIPPGFTHALLLKRGRVVAKGGLDQVLTGKNLTRCFGVNVTVTKWRNRHYALVDD